MRTKRGPHDTIGITVTAVGTMGLVCAQIIHFSLTAVSTVVLMVGVLYTLYRRLADKTTGSEETYRLGYDIGYEAGHREGHKLSRPTVVDMASRRGCHCKDKTAVH